MHPLRAWRLGLPRKQRTLAAAGALLGVGKVQMWRLETGQRRVDPQKVPAIEAITGIPRELLRPDIYRSIGREEGERFLQAAQ